MARSLRGRRLRIAARWGCRAGDSGRARCGAWARRSGGTPGGAPRGADDGGRCCAPTSLRGSPRGRAAQLTSLAALASFRHSAASQKYEARFARRPRDCAARRRRQRPVAPHPVCPRCAEPMRHTAPGHCRPPGTPTAPQCEASMRTWAVCDGRWLAAQVAPVALGAKTGPSPAKPRPFPAMTSPFVTRARAVCERRALCAAEKRSSTGGARSAHRPSFSRRLSERSSRERAQRVSPRQPVLRASQGTHAKRGQAPGAPLADRARPCPHRPSHGKRPHGKRPHGKRPHETRPPVGPSRSG